MGRSASTALPCAGVSAQRRKSSKRSASYHRSSRPPGTRSVLSTHGTVSSNALYCDYHKGSSQRLDKRVCNLVVLDQYCTSMYRRVGTKREKQQAKRNLPPLSTRLSGTCSPTIILATHGTPFVKRNALRLACSQQLGQPRCNLVLHTIAEVLLTLEARTDTCHARRAAQAICTPSLYPEN